MSWFSKIFNNNSSVERATKWEPVSDIDSMFGSISYSFQDDGLSVWMRGTRTLRLDFAKVAALRFEQECPGFDFIGGTLPMLGPSVPFPLLRVKGSQWVEQYTPIYKDLSHFALVSSNHLLQLLAKPDAQVKWEQS